MHVADNTIVWTNNRFSAHYHSKPFHQDVAKWCKMEFNEIQLVGISLILGNCQKCHYTEIYYQMDFQLDLFPPLPKSGLI